MRIAAVQTNPVFGDPRGNADRALAMMERHEADLFVLPELFNTGYVFADREELSEYAEPVTGPTFERIRRFTAGRSCYAVYGFAERADNIYNTCALVGPEGLIGQYRKIHLFDRENTMFAPGNLGLPVFDLPFGKVGLMICFDWIYPEAARRLALRGAQLLVHPSNLVLPHCPEAMIIRCIENRVFVVTSDRVGRETRAGIDLTFIGKSEVISPDGEILVRMGTQEEGVEVVEAELSRALDKKVTERNDIFAGRRPEFY